MKNEWLTKYLPEIKQPDKQEKVIGYGFIATMTIGIFVSILLGLKWGDNLPLIYSAFTSGVLLSMYGISVAKNVKNLAWIVLFSLPLYLISTALINALQGVQ